MHALNILNWLQGIEFKLRILHLFEYSSNYYFEIYKNYYFVSNTITTEAGILHTWFRDIYIVLGDQNDKLWNIKVYINPLVNFIWLGVFINLDK